MSETSNQTNLSLAVFGKYPIDLGSFTFFPLAGIEYQLCLSANNIEDDAKASDFNALWFKAGVGGDYSLNKDLYLRAELLFGLKMNSKTEKDMKDPGYADVSSFFMMGPTVKVGVGYRL